MRLPHLPKGLSILALGLLVLALVGGTPKAHAQTPPAPPETLEELETRIQQVLTRTKTPGAGVALVSREGVLWAAGIGKADVALERDADEDTIFRLGSISKSLVALSLLKLQESGELRLDDKLSDVAPEIAFTNPWEESDPVRLAHLLEHTAGFDDISPREYLLDDPTISLENALAYNPASRTSRWKPGYFSSYSNSGPAVAAYVVAKVSGQPYEEYVQQEFFAPLAMGSASYFSGTIQADLAKSYRADGLTEVPYSNIGLRPSGALNATPSDMARLVQMLLNRGSYQGEALLAPASIDRMELPATTLAAREGLGVGYGLGIVGTTEQGFVWHGHDGAIDGFLSAYAYLPYRGVGYVYSINASNEQAFLEIGQLIRAYLTRDELPPARPRAIPLETQEGTRFTGFYEPIIPPRQPTRFLERLLLWRIFPGAEGTLRLGPIVGSGEPLILVQPDQFRRAEDSVPIMLFAEDATYGRLLLWEGRGFEPSLTNATYRAIPGWMGWLRFGLLVAVLLLMLSTIPFALVWIPRKLLGRMGAQHMSLRALPLLAVLALLVALALLGGAGHEFAARFGERTLWAMAFWLLTWLFAVLTLVSLVQLLRARAWDVERRIWRYSLLVSLANLLVLAYLAYSGLIGLRTWTL